MIGTTFQEFYDKLYYGTDIEMSYGGSDYILSSAGLVVNDKLIKHEIRLYKINTSDKLLKSMYEQSCPKTEDSINNFLNAKIFDGKSFLEIENNVQIDTIL